MIPTFYELNDSNGNPYLTTRNRTEALTAYRVLLTTDPTAVPAVIVNGEYSHVASVAFDREAYPTV
jgi:hypothetical protein